MDKTIEPALNSILRQIDDRFEVIVVDDGSTDKSREILAQMESESELLRTVFLPPDPERNLGKTRNISIRNSRGKFILPHMDTDDRYYPVIPDIVEVFEQLQSQIGYDFYLQGDGINVVKKKFFMKEIGGYRNLPVGGEDLDMWRRLLDNGQVIWLENKLPYEPIGYQKDFWNARRREMTVRTSDFQCGISFLSCLTHSIKNSSPHKFMYDIISYIVAYVLSQRKPHFDTPEKFQKKGGVRKEIESRKKKLTQVEKEYNIAVNESHLSEAGQKMFYLN